jgi:hypothetical protein
MKFWLRLWAVIALLSLAMPNASAHGGSYIVNETRGRYFVVASLAPGPMSVGKGDLSVAVRDSRTYQPLPVSRISVRLGPKSGPPIDYPAAAEGRAEDAIYSVHTLDFNAQGDWQLVVRLENGGDVEEFSATVPVIGGAWRWINVVIYLLPILVLVALVGLASLRNRRLRQTSIQQLETNT